MDNDPLFLSLVVMNGIRGAIATVENTENDILKSTKKLFNTIVENNKLDISKIVSVIFTVTNDLDAAFPARLSENLVTINYLQLIQRHQT